MSTCSVFGALRNKVNVYKIESFSVVYTKLTVGRTTRQGFKKIEKVLNQISAGVGGGAWRG